MVQDRSDVRDPLGTKSSDLVPSEQKEIWTCASPWGGEIPWQARNRGQIEWNATFPNQRTDSLMGQPVGQVHRRKPSLDVPFLTCPYE